ncbi:LysR family transcriptional regulator [soil metagenome]
MDPRKIDLRLLYTLETIHRTGSLTAAGDALGLSQPALSHQLRRLREMFDDPLFLRSPAGMHSTPRAEALVRSILRIQSTVRAELGSSAIFDPKTVDREFNLCMTDVGEMVLLPRLLARLRADAPNVRIKTVSASPRQMMDALDSGEVDLALGPFPELTGAAIKCQRLFDRGFLCLVASDHPAIGEEIDLETYLSQPHMLISSSGRIEETFEKFLRSQKLTRNVVLRVPHMLSAPTVIRESDLIATVPQSVGLLFRNYAGIRAIELPFHEPIQPPRTTVSQFWSLRFDLDPAIMWLRGLVAQIFQRNDPAALEIILTG